MFNHKNHKADVVNTEVCSLPRQDELNIEQSTRVLGEHTPESNGLCASIFLKSYRDGLMRVELTHYVPDCTRRSWL